MNLKDTELLACKLLIKHQLINAGWRFKFDNSKRRFGVCNYSKKIIGLSRHLVELNDFFEVNDTILHEIAHALTPNDKGHGPEWQRKCIEIGARPNRCYKSSEIATPELRYQAVCDGCGHVHQRAKRITHNHKISCKCQRGLPWNEKIELVYVDTYNLVE